MVIFFEFSLVTNIFYSLNLITHEFCALSLLICSILYYSKVVYLWILVVSRRLIWSIVNYRQINKRWNMEEFKFIEIFLLPFSRLSIWAIAAEYLTSLISRLFWSRSTVFRYEIMLHVSSRESDLLSRGYSVS